ncbi:PBECR4 domain-containing protein [Streptococcus anginosus]|uniref:PBECR4 domain-containing protein n=2 Tax=Streptococcus anginosus TaxID=1328 RepID=UPI00300FE86E
MVFTKAQAKSLAILDVARSLGMEMKRKSHREYYWAEHDSFKIDTLKNTWHWYARGTYGDTISLVQEMRNVSYSTAMKFLETGQFPEAKPMEEVRQPFRYTLAAYEQPFKEARTYLKETRGLSDETINFFLDKGVIAQARRRDREGFTEDVLVFKYLDKNQNIVGASLQGLVSYPERYEGKGYLKQIMYQSEGIAGLNISIGSPERLIVAEAPIDLMSYYELHKSELNNVRLVAMEGLKEGVLSRYAMEALQERGILGDIHRDYTKASDLTKTSQFLSNAAKTSTLFHDHKHDDLITLAVDHDKAGTDFLASLRGKNIPVIDARPPKGNGQEKMDWNEYLKKEKAGEKQMAEESSHKEFQAPFFNTEILDKYVEEVAQHYTEDIETAEYLFPDGRLVSSWDYGMRGDDHRAIRNYFDVMGRPELDILNDQPKDFWNLVHNGIGAVRLVPETQTALLLEGQALTTIQREILQSSSLKTEIYQEGQAITATYLKRLGVSSEEKDIDEANQKSLEPFSDAQKEHICEFFKTRISDVKTDYIYLPNGQEDIAYYLNGYLFANHYAELDMLSPSKQVDALMNRLVSEDGQKFDHVALGFDIERIDQKFLEENLGYNPDTPIEDYRYSEKNIDRVAEKEEQEFRTKFDRRSFAEMIGLMQKYSPEEVLNESNSYHDDVRYQSLLIDLGKVNTDPMYRFIEHYINRDIDREALSQFSVQDFITIAQEKGLLNEEPSVKPWKAITVTQPVNSYTVFTDKLSKEFDNVSDLYQFVNKKLKRSQRRELSSLLSESGRGTPLDTLMAIDSVANVEVNGQSILSLFPNDINEEATEIYLRSSAEIEETASMELLPAAKEKAPDRSQEPSGNAGDSHRNPDSLGDLSPGAASKPVVDEPQPDFPVIAHLKFTTKEERMSTIKPGYHVITNGELNRLNKFAPGLQATAQWYLKELSGSTISYLYQDGETLGKLSVQFSDENFAHLTGISPKGIEMRQVVYDFAQGVGDYGNIQVSHAIKDKSMVLPLLPDILSSQSFVFNDLSEVEKFNRIDLSQAIKTNDEDLLLAVRDVDGVGIPASVMRMKEKLSESLKGKENIVLAVYRQRDGKLDQMSINEEYVKDGGKRFEDILKNDEFSRYQEDRYKEETEQLSFKRDSDGDGISDEEELKHGTNPYDFRSTPSQHSVQEETNLLEEAIETSATVAVSDLIKNKDIAGLNQHLKEGIKAYLNSDHYKEFLTKMSQFNQYSSRNLRLILAQKPDASYLAPYNTWRKFDRHVKRGEKALSVIIPVTYVKKDQQGQPILDKNGRPETGMTFRLKPTTFDVSQTEGKEMPKAAEVKEQLTDLDYANLYRALMSIAKTNDVSVRFEEMAGETKGYYSPAEHQIVLRSHDMNKSQLIKTFIHETAHSELHHSNNPQREQLTRSNAELQAESVAYVVASYYGIDTSDYSFDYLAGWSKDKETLADLEAQLDIVQQEAKSLMVRMDQELEQLRLIQQRQSKQHFEQKLQKFKDQSKQAAEEHKQEMKQEAQSKKEEGLSK